MGRADLPESLGSQTGFRVWGLGLRVSALGFRVWYLQRERESNVEALIIRIGFFGGVLIIIIV